MVKKCTKKCAARPKWFFLLIRPIFFFFYAVVIAVAIWHYTILFFCLGKLTSVLTRASLVALAKSTYYRKSMEVGYQKICEYHRFKLIFIDNIHCQW